MTKNTTPAVATREEVTNIVYPLFQHLMDDDPRFWARYPVLLHQNSQGTWRDFRLHPIKSALTGYKFNWYTQTYGEFVFTATHPTDRLRYRFIWEVNHNRTHGECKDRYDHILPDVSVEYHRGNSWVAFPRAIINDAFGPDPASADLGRLRLLKILRLPGIVPGTLGTGDNTEGPASALLAYLDGQDEEMKLRREKTIQEHTCDRCDRYIAPSAVEFLTRVSINGLSVRVCETCLIKFVQARPKTFSRFIAEEVK